MSGFGGRSLTAAWYYGDLTTKAQELARLERSGKPINKNDFDFGVVETCVQCFQPILPPKKISRCSRCKGVLYCGKECGTAHWHAKHRYYCTAIVRYMQKLDETTRIVKQFPWGRLETDGSFSRDIARGRYGVLGGTGTGFWSHKGGPVPHQDGGHDPHASQARLAQEALMRSMFSGFEHLDGHDLLSERHLSDEEGWKLPPRLIPYRDFSVPERRPVLVTEFGRPVNDWDSWYTWRKLPKESIAALLMNFPLTVYRLVVDCLEITDARKGSPNRRVPLEIHMLGVEVELNYVPLFSELALLLPYHDIKLVMFGHSAQKLVTEARSKHPKSLAAKASSTTPVFSYTAPQECGAGSIDVYLYGEGPVWVKPVGKIPDALVACNAGLFVYPGWESVRQIVHDMKIPFGITDYAEQDLDQDKIMLANDPRLRGSGMRPEDYVSDLNPFHSPGQRPLASIRAPNLVNGFTFVVYKKKKAESG